MIADRINNGAINIMTVTPRGQEFSIGDVVKIKDVNGLKNGTRTDLHGVFFIAHSYYQAFNWYAQPDDESSKKTYALMSMDGKLHQWYSERHLELFKRRWEISADDFYIIDTHSILYGIIGEGDISKCK